MVRVDRIIWSIAHRHNPPLPLDTDDLHQEGAAEVWRLLDRWPGADDAHLLNTACLRASGAMVDAIRATRWAGRRHGGLDSTYEPPISLEHLVAADGARTLCIGDTITEPSRPLDVVDAMDTWRHMNDRRRAEMILLHAAGYALREIGDMYGVSESRVSQLLSRGDTVFTRGGRGGGRRVAA